MARTQIVRRRSSTVPITVMPALLATLAVLALVMSTSACTEPSASTSQDAAATRPAPPAGVSALGRLEPRHGIITVSAASEPAAISGTVLSELLVEVGDDVEKGQLLAISDTASLHEARISQTETELALARQEAAAAASVADAACVRAGVAEREASRLTRLRAQDLAAEEETDRARGAAEALAADCTAARSQARVAESAVAVIKARLALHRIELGRSHIEAPVAGRVLAINARPGELVGMVLGMEGILELGDVENMYAIAEVYETDVARLRAGQRATVTSEALPRPLTGHIERIRPKVQKQDQVHTDPAARKDARIVEVEVALDDSEPAAGLTHLQVEVIFEP
ncbi:MAG: efflux RND transporter periplasmic adaptor subunit [Gammaproteobacteria bacterium]